MFKWMRNALDNWLTHEPPATEVMPFDFNRLKHEIRPGDVLLIEGRSRISHIINAITLSAWTHAALYIGRLVDFEDEEQKEIIRKHLPPDADDSTRLVLEGLINQGTVISKLSTYRHHHMRICRPIGISPADISAVIDYALKALGQRYNVRQLLDLARFILPWTLLPRRWGSSLFRTTSGEPEPGICSSLIAEAFSSVQFPILPYAKQDENEGVELFQRNPYLFSPKDFDVSPYFEIIKYPLFNPEEPLPYYRRMPWTKSGFLHQDKGIISGSVAKKKKIDEPANDETNHDEKK
jgi:hypothetical protein